MDTASWHLHWHSILPRMNISLFIYPNNLPFHLCLSSQKWAPPSANHTHLKPSLTPSLVFFQEQPILSPKCLNLTLASPQWVNQASGHQSRFAHPQKILQTIRRATRRRDIRHCYFYLFFSKTFKKLKFIHKKKKKSNTFFKCYCSKYGIQFPDQVSNPSPCIGNTES